MPRILLIEDEESIRKIIRYDLDQIASVFDEASTGKQGLSTALQKEYDVILIDWMLPELSGIEIVKTLRKEGSNAILMMLTARSDESDILQAFEAGVDDYITKPFSSLELMARIQAHLKRIEPTDTRIFEIGNIILDELRRSLSVDGKDVELTKKEFDLLDYMIQRKNIVVSRDEILNTIWGFDYDGDTRIVDVHIFKLRTKLKNSDIEIESSRGIGYMVKSREKV